MTTKHETTRRLPAFGASDQHLVDGYTWAVDQALAWVQEPQDDAPASYWAGLTDRPMFYSRDVAHQALGGHLLGLDAENADMLRLFAASANPERGHYPLWAFMFDGTPAELDYRGDDDFVRETPVVFELVERILEQHLWTGDDRYVDDPVFRGYITASVTEFVQAHDIHGVGIAGERWVGDIFRGSPTYNEGSNAPGLEIAGDGIASQWAALRRIADQLAPSEIAEFAAAEADRIADVFESDWWQPALDTYATGMGADGAVTGFAYEPSWFPAVKSLMAPGPRADAHLGYLDAAITAAPPPNIEAMTYVPEAFLAYGHDEAGLRWIRHLIDSRADYPEVSFCVVSQLLTGLTGLRPLADGSVETASHIGDGWIEAADVPLRDRRVTVRHTAREETELTVHGGEAPLTWTARFGDVVRTAEVAPGETVRLGRRD